MKVNGIGADRMRGIVEGARSSGKGRSVVQITPLNADEIREILGKHPKWIDYMKKIEARKKPRIFFEQIGVLLKKTALKAKYGILKVLKHIR